MLKKVILVAIAALATYSFGGAPVVKTTVQKPVTVILKTFKGSYIPGEVSEEIKQKCTQTISWRADDAAWLKDQFALAPSYSMIADSKRVAVHDIKKIVEAGVDAQFACVFEDTKEQVYVSATFGKTEVTVVVRGKAKKARAGLLDLFDVLVTKKQSNAALYNFLKGVGVVGALAAAKVFLVDPWRKKHDDADQEREREARSEQDERARTAALKKNDDLRKIRALFRLEGSSSYNPIHMKDLVATWSGAEERLKDLTCPQLLECLDKKLHRAISVWELWGPRSAAEDAVDVYKNGDWLAFAVYDGHGGDQTALALAGMKKGAGNIAERDPLAQQTRLLPFLVELVQQHGVAKEKIVELYRTHDEKLAAVAKRSGSTAVVLVINRKTLKAHFINLGDSRAVAVDEDGIVINATKDHSPECEKECTDTKHATSCEVKRIQDAGGFVYCGRVGASLAVARAFGDFDLKPSDTGHRKYHVGIEPEIVSFNLQDASQIVLACDGVWDVVLNKPDPKELGLNNLPLDDVGSILIRAFDGNFNPAEYLCKTAIKTGSVDNISAIVVDADALRVLCGSVVAGAGVELSSDDEESYSDTGHGVAGRVSLRRLGRDVLPQITGLAAQRLAEITSALPAFRSTLLHKYSNKELFQRLHVVPSKRTPHYPVQEIEAGVGFDRIKAFQDPLISFHKICDGLFLGNNDVIRYLCGRDSNAPSLDEINNLGAGDRRDVMGWRDFATSNPQAMDRLPTLVITFDDLNSYPKLKKDNIEVVAGIECLYLPLPEQTGGAFAKILANKHLLFSKIIEHLNKPQGNVLFHCHAGNHRSVGALLYFLFEAFNQEIPLFELSEYIYSKRRNAKTFSELAQGRYNDNGISTMPTTNLFYQLMVHCCGNSGIR